MKKRVMALLLGLGMVFSLTQDMQAEAASNRSFSKEVFDAQYYYDNYEDLQQNIGNDPDKLLEHYIKHGMAEGRWGSADFNAKIYRSNYSDLEKAYGNNWSKYCYHYMNYGAAEGREAAEVKEQGTQKTTYTATISSVTYSDGTVLGTYSTNYDPDVPRATNIDVAVSRINGVIVSPGAEFSFSNTILPRTSENGYVSAPVFINKKKAYGIGGGICQVSSTMYAALLQANISVTERHPHSLPVTYIPAGMDATISGTSKDLKFINTTQKPIQIQATTNGNSGTVSISLVQVGW